MYFFFSAGSDDMDHFGVSFFWNLQSFLRAKGWTRGLSVKKVTRPHGRANRPILIPSVPVSKGIEIRHGCQFLSSSVRTLAKLPGGLGRFLPCRIGSHMSRLRHPGWNQCSHGLTLGLWNPVIISPLRLYVGFWCVLRVQHRSFWMAH